MHPISKQANITSSHSKNIIVIGAGIGGLSAAIHLAAKGHHVTILERQPRVGGKLNYVEIDGFSFDTGPSLITMPHVLYDLFHIAIKKLEDYLDLIPLDITCRYFYRDGIVLDAWRNHQKLADEFARLCPHDDEAFFRFYNFAKGIYEAAEDPFLYHSLGSPLDVMRTFVRYVLKGHPGTDKGDEGINEAYEQDSEKEATTLFSRLNAVLAALSPQTLDQCVRSFFKDPHLHQLFDRYATYNGSSPYRVASVYSNIPYVELANGGWYPRGGIYAIARALEQVARELGVNIETNCDVRRILVQYGEARGVVLANGQIRHADVIVANSDVVTTHRELLSPAVQKPSYLKKLERLEPSCSGFVLLLGTDKRYPQLSHHNIFFSDDYPAEFRDLFESRIPLRNPTIYVCATTRTDATQAPPGCENLFVLVNAPYLTKQSNWKHDAGMYRDHILDLLASYPQGILSDLREHIVCEQMLTPEDFYQKYGSNAGSIYGLSSNARMAPFTRPGNRSDIDNLYFVGGSTHPGGGVPLVILSGKIVADLIEQDSVHV
ncbi:MAG TPA: phytoene desaturase [Ktedonobacter sp.]|nr:phytoene desaturase [Ktedonobacter sp.]